MIRDIPTTNLTSRLNWSLSWLHQHWLLVFNILWGLYVLMPFAAPIFMKIGLPLAAKGVYLFYSTQCHQFPERSYFLFGPKVMYSLGEINIARGSTNTNMFELRNFIGTAQMGWKVAWSDRMISLWGSVFATSLLFALFRNRLPRPLKLLPLIILLVPITLDGSTHFLSDVQSLAHGFRATNDWLRLLTGGMFSNDFYQGDSLGSFNSLMRLITGVIAGWGIALFALPYLNTFFARDKHPVSLPPLVR